MKILEQKKDFEETYSDLNLWSFSNAGTGASCEIERVPNSLIKTLINLQHTSPEVRKELEDVLNNNESAYSFLNSLEDNAEWWLLYPNVFGTGKKKVEYNGVSVAFLEAYFKEIENTNKIEYANYLAYLIEKYKSKSFEKYLSSTSAWNEKNYRIDLYAVFVEATKNEEWSLNHQLEILDNKDQIPPKNSFYNIHKLTHYFYQKKVFNTQLPALNKECPKVKTVCEWANALIEKDVNKAKDMHNITVLSITQQKNNC